MPQKLISIFPPGDVKWQVLSEKFQGGIQPRRLVPKTRPAELWHTAPVWGALSSGLAAKSEMPGESWRAWPLLAVSGAGGSTNQSGWLPGA